MQPSLSHAGARPLCYRLLGWRVWSQIPLPGLTATGAGEPDIVVLIDRGPAPSSDDWSAAGDGLWGRPGEALAVTDAGVALIEGGRRVTVFPAPGQGAEALALLILGPALAALCQQRQVVPLHAAAVRLDGRTVLVAGASGAGKSTLTAWWASHGARVLGDDLAAVTRGLRQGFILLPPPGRLKLWPEALDLAQPGSSDFAAPAPLAAGYEKLGLALNRPATRPMRVDTVVVLTGSQESTVSSRPLSGAAAAAALIAQVRSWPLAAAMGVAEALLDSVVALAAEVRLFELQRPSGLSTPSRVAMEIGRMMSNRRF